LAEPEDVYQQHRDSASTGSEVGSLGIAHAGTKLVRKNQKKDWLEDSETPWMCVLVLAWPDCGSVTV
jgi:hypothetical protein